jgi:hypothetical protein
MRVCTIDMDLQRGVVVGNVADMNVKPINWLQDSSPDLSYMGLPWEARFIPGVQQFQISEPAVITVCH